MFTAITTTIGFNIPDEYEEMMMFREENDMKEWVEIANTGYVAYTRTRYYMTERRKKVQTVEESDTE